MTDGGWRGDFKCRSAAAGRWWLGLARYAVL
jgi:hypothetical protein